MATHNLTYKFGNNFENEASAGTVTVPAKLEFEGGRGTVPAVFIQAGDVVSTVTIPANAVIKNFYLITEEAMTGTVTVTIDGGATTIFTAADITVVGIAKSAVVDVYTTAPSDIEFTFSATQTAGSVKVAYDFIQLDTNTAKYIVGE